MTELPVERLHSTPIPAEAARVAEARRAEIFGEFAGKQERQPLAQGV